MRIAFSQVKDALAAIGAIPTESPVMVDQAFSRVELFDGQQVEDDVLYVTDACGVETAVAGSWLLCGDGRGIAEGLAGCPVAAVPNVEPVQAANAIARYQARLGRCLDAMRESYYVANDLQGFCQSLSDFVGNPVLAYDDALLPVAQTEFPQDVARRIFGSDRMDAGYVFRTIPDWERGEESTVFTRTGAERVRNADGTVNTAVCRIFYEGEMQGFLEIFQVNGPITDGHMQVLETAARILSVAIPFRGNNLLVSGLSGHATQADLAGRWLASLRWNAEDGMYVLAVDLPALYSDDRVTMSHVMRILRSVLPNSACVQMDDVPVLVANDKIISRDRALRTLSTFLSTNSGQWCIGASEVLAGVGGLHEGYVHAKFAAEYARDHGGLGSYVRFEECRFAFTADLCNFADNKRLLVDPAVGKMHDEDRASGSEYVPTLKCYIESGFSLNATAKELMVHRNTVAYRLKVVADKYGLDLSSPIDDPELVFQVLLSCKVLLDA